MGTVPEPITTVIFQWGSGVFACSDKSWQVILECVARQSEYRLEEIVQRRCQRLSDRPLVQLGTMTAADAEARLAGRKQALEGTPEAPPPVVRIAGQPPRYRESA